MKIVINEEGVSPVVATLVLIVVAIIGSITIAYILGAFTTDISKQVAMPTPTPSPVSQIFIVDSPLTYALDQQLSQQYMAQNGGVNITLQSSPDEYLNTESLSMNISDIVSLFKAPSSSLLFKDPKVQTHLIGGRAVVMIANSNMNIPSLSQSDLSMVYSQTQQNIPANLTGLTTVVRNADGTGSEAIFTGWLTDDMANSLDGQMIMPAGVQNYTAHSESEVISKVSGTHGAIGFVSWRNVANNNPSISNITIIPVVNKNNLMVQMPGENAINNEIAKMDNANYDNGLIGGLYYLTEGQPSPLIQGYISWCQAHDTYGAV